MEGLSAQTHYRKDTMKRKTTKEILCESLQELALTKNVEKITIREITDNCGYSPATFYRHFKDKYDLIAWDYSERYRQLSEKADSEGFLLEDFLLESAYYYMHNREYLANLLSNTRGSYSFEQYMTRVNYDFLLRLIKKRTPEPDRNTGRYLMVYCIGGVRYNMEWLLGHIDATPEEMADIYLKTIPEPVYRQLI